MQEEFKRGIESMMSDFCDDILDARYSLEYLGLAGDEKHDFAPQRTEERR